MASQSIGLNSASRAPLGLKHLEIVLDVCQGCSARWERLGLRLGLHNDTIEQIERDQNKSIEQMRVMLSEWLKENYEVSDRYPEPSQHSLCIAVAGIDRSLAETISKKLLFSDISVVKHASARKGSMDLHNSTQGSHNDRTPYTTDELMQLCTCTKCDEETIITTGCPDRKEFHALDTKRLSQEQWEVYLGYAIEKIQEMKDKWSETYDKISQSISRNNEISVSRLKTIIKTLEWFGETKEKNSRLKRLNECQDKESIFDVYAEICSWLNHHPLERIVHKCGTENDKQEYENYVAKTERFLRHSITFFTESCSQDLGGAVTEVKRFRLKVNTELRLDGTILQFLRRQVAKLLDISHMNLCIWSLKEGCFEVVFSIPEVTYKNCLRALENMTYEPLGLKFKSVHYSDVDAHVHTLSAKSDEEDISFPDTKEQTISYPTDKVQVLSLLVNHTGKGQTKSKNNIHVTDDTLWTPETSDGARKHRLGSNNYKDEDNPFDIIGTDLSERMSEQNEADIELDYIVQSGRIRGKRPQISMRRSLSSEFVESNDFGCPNLKRQKKE